MQYKCNHFKSSVNKEPRYNLKLFLTNRVTLNLHVISEQMSFLDNVLFVLNVNFIYCLSFGIVRNNYESFKVVTYIYIRE